MSKQDYFEVIQPFDQVADRMEAVIRFNADHSVFKGHFPNQPVVPGVCMIAIVRYLTGMAMQKDLEFMEVSQLKFIRMIDPSLFQDVKVSVSFKVDPDHPIVNVNASFTIEDTTCFKFVQGIYRF